MHQNTPMNTYILADNQYITAKGLQALLEEYSLADTIVCAASLKELQQQLRKYPDSIVVVDYTLFNFVSAQQMLIVRDAAAKSSWILFSDQLGGLFLRQVLVSDPSFSVMMKQDSQEEMLATLKSVSLGAPYVCSSVQAILKETLVPTSSPVNLTAMEKTILHEIALGKTTKEIAYEKTLSFHTVNTHRRNIFRKLEVNNVHEAVKYALRAGLIDIAEYCI